MLSEELCAVLNNNKVFVTDTQTYDLLLECLFTLKDMPEKHKKYYKLKSEIESLIQSIDLYGIIDKHDDKITIRKEVLRKI